MDITIVELALKELTEGRLTDDEKNLVRNYNLKYALVRYLVMEKSSYLQNFHFTPGEKFMETPTIDIVNECLKGYVGKPFRFNDRASNPPVTGREKQQLI